MKHHKVYRTELTPVSFLERSAYVFPDKVAVVHGARRYTYAQLAERVNRLASALPAAGMGNDDPVAYMRDGRAARAAASTAAISVG